jgi:dTDP-4-amino-4,6-dideoxygalactose transaminase
MQPAVLGGPPAFSEGLPLVRPTIPDVPGLARRLEAILNSGMLTNGPTVRELEEAAAERCDVRHAVAVSSCTAGLMLVLQAVGARGRVVMPSFTFAASAHAVVWAGGQPVWGDVRLDNMTLDTADVAQLLDGASAMTATHVYGAPCDVEGLQKLADDVGIPLVYDAAHALGSRRGATPIGGFGTAEVFSLSPTKVAVAGEGGLVTTNDEDLASHLRHGRDYGNPGDYNCLFAGLNARMSELHAAVALASLDGLDARIADRNRLAAAFRQAIPGTAGLGFQHVDDGDLSTYKDLTLVVDAEAYGLSAAELATALKAEGIDSRRYYAPPIHRQRAYAHVPSPRALPVTDLLAESVLTTPLYSHMTVDEVVRVAEVIRNIHEHAVEVRSAVRNKDTAIATRGHSYAVPRPSTRFAPTRATQQYFDQRSIRWSSPAYSALAHDFSVACERPDLFEPQLTPLLEPYVRVGETRNVYRILDRGNVRRGRWALYFDDERVALSTTMEQAVGTLIWHVNREVVRRTSADRLLLHAAAAERHGRGVILAAPMENGKTTTVTGLLQAGYRYLTDETVALDPHTLLIDPFPKPLTLDRGSWHLFPDLKPPSTDHASTSQWHVPIRVFGPEAVAGPTQPAVLLFPRYERDAVTRLEPLSPGEAFEMLMRCVFRFTEHGQRNFACLTELVRRLPRYRLVVSDLSRAVALIDAAMARGDESILA